MGASVRRPNRETVRCAPEDRMSSQMSDTGHSKKRGLEGRRHLKRVQKVWIKVPLGAWRRECPLKIGDCSVISNHYEFALRTQRSTR
jgi:hypothetical protein